VSAPRASVLIVAQFAPPAGFSAARRTHGLAKYLERLGHRVTVLTSLASGHGSVPDASRTVRSRDLVASRVNWRRASFEAARGGGGAYAEPSPIASLVVPDLSLIGWLPFVLPRARALARAKKIDCVLTTSPPESAHLVGMALARAGTPWIADLRDGWTFESTHPEWPLSIQSRLDAGLERAVVRRADLVTTVTDEITNDLRTRLGACAITLPNGFDPGEAVGTDVGDVGLDPQRHSIVHTGRMGFSGRSPRPLLDGLEILRRRHPDLAARVELVFAGPLSAEEREQIKAAGDDGSVRGVGTLDRRETLRLQKAADTLLLLTGRGRRSEATAKLYEYLAAGRPILVLGEGSAAARVVRETGAGSTASADDPVAIAAALEKLMYRPKAAAVRREAAGRYSYPRIAAELSDHVQRLTAVGLGRQR
jgi:glycosyltransferase involved in cell wall biosynthesis